MDLLLQQGAYVDVLNKVDNTTAELHWRSIANVARFLAEYKGDANIRNKIRSTTLDTAHYGVDEEVDCRDMWCWTTAALCVTIRTPRTQGLNLAGVVDHSAAAPDVNVSKVAYPFQLNSDTRYYTLSSTQ